MIRCTLLFILLAGCVSRAPDSVPGDVVALNESFLRNRDQARNRMVGGARPVLVDLGDQLVLVQGKTRATHGTETSDYIILKAYTHAAITLSVLVEPDVGMLLGAGRLDAIRSYQDRLAAAEAALPGLGLSRSVQDRQRHILRECQSFSEQVLQQRRVTQDQLDRWARSIMPLVRLNVDDAAEIHLAGLNDIVQPILAGFTRREQQQFMVIVAGAHEARDPNLAMQYFEALLAGSETEDHRIVYLEGNFTVDRALQLAGDILLDIQVSRTFFDRPDPLDQDVMGKAAARWLKAHPPTMPPPAEPGSPP